MQSIKAILRQKWFWICQNKPFWASVCFAVITLAFVAVKPATVNGAPTDLPVRFWGMCLQLIGAYTVWMDMTKTARDFGEPPSFRKTLRWIKRLFRTPAPIHLTAVIKAKSGMAVASGLTATVSSLGQPIEQRVARLEGQLTGIKEELSAVRADALRQTNELTAAIEKSTAELRQEIGTIQTQLKDALVGNYAVLHFGAVWLVVGIVMSSVAVEITNFFHLNHQLPAFW